MFIVALYLASGLLCAIEAKNLKGYDGSNYINIQIGHGPGGAHKSNGAVGFYAYVTTKHLQARHNQVIVFDNVITNEGSGYNSKTGVFTVPVSGMYLLSWTISASHNAAVVTRLTLNGKSVGHIYADGASRAGFISTASKVPILWLHKGDKVSVVGGHYTRGVLWSDQHQECSFSGALLSPMPNK